MSSVIKVTNNTHILLDVSGILYHVEREVLLKYPEGFFTKLLTSDFKESTEPSIAINRDGSLFRYVYEYMSYGKLPRDENGGSLLTRDQLEKVKDEAEFYQLAGLIQECEYFQKNDVILNQMKIFKSFQSQIEELKEAWSTRRVEFGHDSDNEDWDDYDDDSEAEEEKKQDDDKNNDEESKSISDNDSENNMDDGDKKATNDIEADVDNVAKVDIEKSDKDNNESDEEDSDNGSEESKDLLSILSSIKAVPAWITGTIPESCNATVYKATTLRNVNVDEILEAATPSPFGHGKRTKYDPAVRDSMEIQASQLEGLTEVVRTFDISALAPHRDLVIEPYKLVVYKEGGHFDEHRDTVRKKDHIGTLVLVLHSEYTGGELQLDHGGQSVSVTGGGNWVAMYGDVMHLILPVTSGARVSLIFDIFSRPKSSDSKEDSNRPRFIDTVPMIEKQVCKHLYAAIDKEFETYEKVSITLSHLYPECQANLDFLKGEDQALYNSLVTRYKVKTTPIFVARKCYDGDVEMDYETFRFSTKSKRSRDIDRKNPKDVLFVPKPLKGRNKLFYSPSMEWTGNNAEKEKSVYLVTALTLRKRNKKN